MRETSGCYMLIIIALIIGTLPLRIMQTCPAQPTVNWSDLNYNNPAQIATRTGTISVIGSCSVTVSFPEGDSLEFQVGRIFSTLIATVGMTVTVNYDRISYGVGYISGPFEIASPSLAPKATPSGGRTHGKKV